MNWIKSAFGISDKNAEPEVRGAVLDDLNSKTEVKTQASLENEPQINSETKNKQKKIYIVSQDPEGQWTIDIRMVDSSHALSKLEFTSINSAKKYVLSILSQQSKKILEVRKEVYSWSRKMVSQIENK